MDVAILHYHLNPGGVTRVILNHLASLATCQGASEPGRVVILYGGQRQGWPDALPEGVGGLDVRLQRVPELAYDEVASSSSAVEVCEALTSALRKHGLNSADTVLHVHNHALGKNASLPAALSSLACQGYALLLQIHDFAEDFRPVNYHALVTSLTPAAPCELSAALYPQAAQVHYAVLNRRDREILRQAGFASSRLHFLPNPVTAPPDLPAREASRAKLSRGFGISPHSRLLLYPVRGIRRKNVAEAILWSVLGRGGGHVGMTLAPLNPRERTRYLHWKRFAAERRLPCHFELGGENGLSYAENLSAADWIVSTSVAEGFGMAFLEPWLIGRPLVGRDLPEITADFVEAGLCLDELQAEVRVPLGWIGRRAFFESLQTAYLRVLQSYARPQPSSSEFAGELERLIADGCVDFARLDSALQQRVLERLTGESAARRALLRVNERMAEVLQRAEPDEAVIRHNAEVARRAFSPEGAGRRLSTIYAEVVASDREVCLGPPPGGDRILREFLKLSRFHPIRTET